MKQTQTERERATLVDLASTYLSHHDDLKPEEKQLLFRELQHQRERVIKSKTPKDDLSDFNFREKKQ